MSEIYIFFLEVIINKLKMIKWKDYDSRLKTINLHLRIKIIITYKKPRRKKCFN